MTYGSSSPLVKTVPRMFRIMNRGFEGAPPYPPPVLALAASPRLLNLIHLWIGICVMRGDLIRVGDTFGNQLFKD
jgi:hypothetical protein